MPAAARCRHSPKQAEGEATIETFTVLHDRDGAPHHGVVILRTADGRRTLGRVPGTRCRHHRAAEAPRPHADRHARGVAPCRGRIAGLEPKLMSDAVLFEVVEPHIALVTINRPEARNAVNAAVAAGIEAAVERVERTPTYGRSCSPAPGRMPSAPGPT